MAGCAGLHPPYELSLDILDSEAAALAQALPRLLEVVREAWIVFEPKIGPVVFGRKADQQSSRFSIAGDDDASASASRINRERSFWISDSGTRLTLDLRVV